jgi:hypothetical protein
MRNNFIAAAIFLVLGLCLLLGPSCASRNKSPRGVVAPAHLKGRVEYCMAKAHVELSKEVPGLRPFDFGRARVKVREVPTLGNKEGRPVMRFLPGNYWHFAEVQGNGTEIVVPVGVKDSTLIHECGHVIMKANRRPDWHEHKLKFYTNFR